MSILGTLKVMLTADSGKFAQDMKAGQKAVNAFKDEIPGLGKALNLLTNPAVLAGSAIVALGKFAQDSFKEYVAYADQVRDLSRALDTNAEESSKLI